MDKIETDSIWVILKNVGALLFKFMEIAWIKVVFPQNHLFCNLMIILSLKEFHITIS